MYKNRSDKAMKKMRDKQAKLLEKISKLIKKLAYCNMYQGINHTSIPHLEEIKQNIEIILNGATEVQNELD